MSNLTLMNINKIIDNNLESHEKYTESRNNLLKYRFHIKKLQHPQVPAIFHTSQHLLHRLFPAVFQAHINI